MHGSGPQAGRGRSAVLIAGPTASGKSALALAFAERHGGIVINAEFHAGLSRSAHHHGAAERGRGGARRRIGSTATSMRRRTIRSAAGAGTCAAALDEAARDGPAADPGRRHRALLQGADPGAVGGAADAARGPRGGAGAGRRRRRRGAARRARPPRSGDGGAAQARRHDADLPRAGGAGGDRAVAGGLASRRHAGDPRSRSAR